MKSNIWRSYAEARKSFKTITKNKAGYNYNYATLDEILEAVEPALLEHGLIVTHSIKATEAGNLLIRTAIVDVESGETLPNLCEIPVSVKGLDPQKVGSAITYFRRYGLLAILNLFPVESDDDGEKASGDRIRRGASKNTNQNRGLAPNSGVAAGAPKTASKPRSEGGQGPSARPDLNAFLDVN